MFFVDEIEGKLVIVVLGNHHAFHSTYLTEDDGFDVPKETKS